MWFRRCASRLLAAAVEYVRRTAPAVIARGALVGCHGDFNTSNILVHAGGISVADFTDYHRGSSFEDVAYFMGMLEKTHKNLTAGDLEKIRASLVAAAKKIKGAH